MGVTKIDLHIEDLVLRGFSPLDGAALRDSIESELTRLIETRGLKASEGSDLSIDAIDAGRFKVAPGARPQATGAQIAQSIYGSLGGNTGRKGRR
jgi:hypothetical protein